MVGNGGAFFEALQQRGIIVRPLAPYGMAEFVRITIGTVAENERLLEAAREIAQNSEVSAQL
jgi:histidinol-phosphate aminotransferase